MIGWGNVSVAPGGLQAELGYVAGQPPPDRRFVRAMEAELERLRVFLAAGFDTQDTSVPLPILPAGDVLPRAAATEGPAAGAGREHP